MEKEEIRREIKILDKKIKKSIADRKELMEKLRGPEDKLVELEEDRDGFEDDIYADLENINESLENCDSAINGLDDGINNLIKIGVKIGELEEEIERGN